MKFSTLLICASAAVIAYAQTPAPAQPLAFEVATIKPARPLQEQALSGKMHVGEKIDGARVDYGSMSLADLITKAYDVKSFQVVGPDWLKTERFDILAKIPDGVSKDKVPQMLQALLADRFKLAIHRDSREHSVYELVVGKDGSKLKESPPDEPEPAADAPPPKEEKGVTTLDTGQGKVSVKTQTDSEGGVTASMKGPNGLQQKMTFSNGVMHIELNKATMEQLAETMSRFLDKPVVDRTGLKGNFQVALDVTMQEIMNAARSAGVSMPMAQPADAKAGEASDPAGTSLVASLQQMGLKLESRKDQVETIVIDHIEKTPTEN